ncbi:hypothetical protein GLOIN_2v1543171 [Rhizophagus clarus]|uniref:Uncharacterized protein n=1 Tax=Rhizophagus clarus TaxID=94130 RepID=A0A8H3MAY2_9GLOM|nr:hypothetical protein GLOIN_2v1543171 [Rhizophagus clarus]
MDQQSVRKVVTHNYPEDFIIEYSESERSYTYNIIEKGNYPPVAYLKYTKRQNDIGKEDVEDMKHKARATVEAFSSERKKITQKINIILISLINISPSSDNSVNSEAHIDDVDIINNVQQSISKDGRQNIIDILKYLIPSLIKKEVIHVTNPKIHLRISGNGRNVRKKVKHVIVTFSILDDKDTLQQPDSHYTIALYPDIEKYEMLHTALEYLIMELRKLKEEGLIDNQGMNVANSKCFCPWSEISKEQRGNFSYEWTISKNMDQVCENFKFYKGYI